MVEPTVEGLRKMLSTMAELRDQAEARANEASRQFVRLLEKYATEEVDRRLKSGEMLDSLPIAKLATLLEDHIDKRNAQADRIKSSRGSEIEQLDKAIAEANRYKEEAANEKLQISELRLENKTMRAEFTAKIEMLESRLQDKDKHPSGSSSRSDHTPTPEPHILPSATSNAPVSEKSISTPPAENAVSSDQTEITPLDVEKWKASNNFERESACLQLLGETGLSRRPMIDKRLADLFGIKSANAGSITNMIARMKESGLIEVFRPWDEIEKIAAHGSYPDLIRLSPMGRSVYQKIFKSEAIPNEYDQMLPVHQTPVHTLLNLFTKDILRDAGYTIVGESPDIHLPNDHLFQPDIVAQDADRNNLYIEVERDTRKSMRAEKWQNAHDAGGGRMYVMCENRNTMSTIRNEINYALTDYVLHISSIPDVLSGKRGEGDSIWLEIKKKERIVPR